jgi:hypothetical protein
MEEEDEGTVSQQLLSMLDELQAASDESHSGKTDVVATTAMATNAREWLGRSYTR